MLPPLTNCDPGDENDYVPDVEQVEARVTALQVEREAMRLAGTRGNALERNRLALVAAQQELSRALIARHAPKETAC